MKAIVIIPARYASTRFQGKPLAPLLGKPMIQWTYESAQKATTIDQTMVATDDERICTAVRRFGGNAVMTSPDHPSGTDRLAEVARNLDCEIVVNVQGDEPLIRPEMIDDVIAVLDDKRASLGTLVKRIDNPDEITDPNVVKVVFDPEMFALYFSRAPMPFHRDDWKIRDCRFQIAESSLFEVYKHIGIYSYRREALIAFSGMRPTRLEQTEKLEQLRALEHGMKIKVRETFFETYGVDTPEDLERVEKWLSTSL